MPYIKAGGFYASLPTSWPCGHWFWSATVLHLMALGAFTVTTHPTPPHPSHLPINDRAIPHARAPSEIERGWRAHPWLWLMVCILTSRPPFFIGWGRAIKTALAVISCRLIDSWQPYWHVHCIYLLCQIWNCLGGEMTVCHGVDNERNKKRWQASKLEVFPGVYR